MRRRFTCFARARPEPCVEAAPSDERSPKRRPKRRENDRDRSPRGRTPCSPRRRARRDLAVVAALGPRRRVHGRLLPRGVGDGPARAASRRRRRAPAPGARVSLRKSRKPRSSLCLVSARVTTLRGGASRCGRGARAGRACPSAPGLVRAWPADEFDRDLRKPPVRCRAAARLRARRRGGRAVGCEMRTTSARARAARCWYRLPLEAVRARLLNIC